MNCPHCNKGVSLFATEINRFGRKKECPHCHGSVKVGINWKRALLLFIPLVIASLLLQPLFGALTNPIIILFSLLLTIRLERVA